MYRNRHSGVCMNIGTLEQEISDAANVYPELNREVMGVLSY